MSLQPLREEGSIAEDYQAGCKSTRDGALRFFTLFFCAVGGFGNYYFYDQLSAIQDHIVGQSIISQEEFGYLSSIYSVPGTLSPFFAGLIINSFGVRLSLLGFTLAVTVGSGLFTFGLLVKSVPILFISRFIFGLGGESQFVANATLLTRWFYGKELSFALAMSTTVGRLGSVGAFDTQSPLIEHFGLIGASCVSTCTCVCALVSALIAISIDKYADRCDAAVACCRPSAATHTDDAVHLRQVLKLPKLFWMVAFCCAVVQIPAFPFFSVTSQQYLTGAGFGFSNTRADEITSISEIVCAIVGPALGSFVDCFGRRHLVIFASSLGMVLSDVAFLVYPMCTGWGSDSIVYVYVLLGVSLALFAAVIWPSIPLTVDEDKVGTAFGVAVSMQNVGMALSPAALNWLYIWTGGCTGPFIFLISVGCVGFIFSLCIWALDRKQGKRLARP